LPLPPRIARIAQAAHLTTSERNILAAAGVTAEEDVYGLLLAFPSLFKLGLRMPVLSNAVAPAISATFAAASQGPNAAPRTASLGAAAPDGTSFAPGFVLDLPTAIANASAARNAGLSAPAAPGAASISAINLLPSGAWPVRFQGNRGTCVAFGTTAMVEWSVFAAEGPNPDYAEQFLYWAIKTHTADPKPNADGTWLQFARDALANPGVCHEALWPYVTVPVTPISGATATDPSAAAVADATTHVFAPTAYMKTPVGTAAALLALLTAGRPVAICMPVFGDPAGPNGSNNWSTAVGWQYGRVLNPPPTSVVVGGHCVCVVGFVPDTTEPAGGYFIIRNSWDTSWGWAAPAGGPYHSPAPGYGDISASYVDQYCWEYMQL
jgi:C1A family cysteine protease